MLDALACISSKTRGAKVEGRVLLNGAPCSAGAVRELSAYVQQQDVLLPSATVREVVLASAQLRLPYAIPLETKRKLVEEALRDLDLLACADTLIGDELRGLKGVSGGERRRTSVAAELVKDPRLLFLDEPSSGLDSETAMGVVAALSRLARKGRTVICTLHQPNSDITEVFDDLMLLAGGRVVYGGPWAGAVGFFARAGFSCPSFKNPADYFLQVMTRSGAEAVDQLTSAYAAGFEGLWGDSWVKDNAAPPASRPKLGLASGPADPKGPSSTTEEAADVKAEAGTGASAQAAVWEQAAGEVVLEIRGDKVVEDERPSPCGSGSCSCYSSVGLPSPSGDEDGCDCRGGKPSASAPCVREVLTRYNSGGMSGDEETGGVAVELRCFGDGGDAEGPSDADERQSSLGIPLWYKVVVLSERRWRTWFRDPLYLTRELAQYVCFAVFVGLVYARFSSDLGVGDYARSTCVFVMLCTLGNVPPNTAVATWHEERVLLKRELDDRLYSVTAYYLARYSVLLPFALAQVSIFLTILYFMAGFVASASSFFTFFGVMIMFQMISEGIGACFAALTRTITAGLLSAMLCLMFCVAFGGFLTTTVPVYFEWIHKTSYFTYAYSALMETEFSKTSFVSPQTGQVVPGMQVFPRQLVTGLSYSGNIGVLAAQCAAMELIKLATFHVSYWTGRI
ncbi:hypothetical protein HYH03_005034 [Edaphochlamys debaryana]|uniref:ABC transporter domain-containing protein n=1 Tax=Edaphochlamys debaryana TaxID=47281 RepID=A0A835YA38_9CHLO|nr:hypothetical protein HYH03_005034 [Edaphochlamys debaryana]|eukprot:KAG2497031.1 hypothetical protein HYH03_005034 [Edaphochlamys debaryana]